jgi:hypothetical protein
MLNTASYTNLLFFIYVIIYENRLFIIILNFSKMKMQRGTKIII